MHTTTTRRSPVARRTDLYTESLFAFYADEADAIGWAEYDEECARRSLARSQDHGPDDCPSCGGCGEGPTPDTNCGTCRGHGWAQ